MIKTSHDSGGVFPVPDTATADWDALRARLRNRLGTSYYLNKRESQYRSIPPAVVVEELLRPDPGGAVSDLKLFCFHGKVRFMVLIFQGMRDKTSQRRFFDRDWIPLEVNRTRHGFRLGMAPRPEGLERIIAQAEALAEPFAFVRVDFLLANGRRYVGELTFTPTAGYERFHPDAFERAAGDMLDLHRATPDWRPYLRAAQRFLPPEGPSAAISPQVAAEEKRVAEAAR
jgi:hypothetical protein